MTDGSKFIVGKNISFVGLLRKSNVNVPALHCVIHQEVLCGKTMNLNSVMNTVPI